MTTKAIIIPYFGKFNDFFPFFLSSCGYNDDYTFFIFTDDRSKFNYPKNCKVTYLDFDEFVKVMQKHFDFNISLETPYKLCDFKPTYGDVFYELIKSFDYWGFCDVDLIFGKLSHFYTDDLLSKYDRVSDAGHFSLFKNNQTMRKAYKNIKHKGCYFYKDVYSSNASFAFDEWGSNKGFNRILINNGYKVFYSPILFADIRIDTYGLRTTKEIYDIPELAKLESTKKHIIYSFDNGVLLQHSISKQELCSSEQSYLHLQKRPMKIRTNSLSKFIIVPPSTVESYSNSIDIKYLKSIKERRIYWNYLELRLNNLLKKLHFKN